MTTATRVKTYDFSWSRTGKTFRLRADGEEILADRIAGFQGMVFIESADGHTGHMRITAAFDRLDSGEIIFYLPEGYERPEAPEGAAFATWNQLCFARKEEKWRVWDKADRNSTLEFVDSYHGPAYIDWHDRGGHIYVHGHRWYEDTPAGRVAMFAGDKP